MMYVIVPRGTRIEILPAIGRSYGAFYKDTGDRAYPDRLPLRVKRSDAVRNLCGLAKEKGWRVCGFES